MRVLLLHLKENDSVRMAFVIHFGGTRCVVKALVLLSNRLGISNAGTYTSNSDRVLGRVFSA